MWRPGAVATDARKGRAHREKVNAKVMVDPRMQKAPPEMPFDPRRMAYVGFQTDRRCLARHGSGAKDRYTPAVRG